MKTWVMWIILALSGEKDSEKIPVALASPDRPFLSKDECQEGVNNAISALNEELKKAGVEHFAVLGTCVSETHGMGGLDVQYM